MSRASAGVRTRATSTDNTIADTMVIENWCAAAVSAGAAGDGHLRPRQQRRRRDDGSAVAGQCKAGGDHAAAGVAHGTHGRRCRGMA